MRYDDHRAEAYDDRYRARFAEAGDAVDFLARLARPPGPVLELGIGTGRLALPLAASGLDVHGVDASPAMLARLRAKPGGEAIPVVEGDFAGAATLLDRRYALVFVAFNTFFELASQDDQVRCFRGVASHLLAGGVFVVEAIVPGGAPGGDALTVLDVRDDRVSFQATRHDPGAQVVTGHTVTVTGDGGIALWPLGVRYATIPELDLMARAAGLRLRERWSGWTGEPFTDDSVRHVSVYEK